MEKRKLLLVAISAGIFLVIAIGAAIVFTPQDAVVTPRAATFYPAPGGTAINVTPPAPHMMGQPPTPIGVDGVDGTAAATRVPAAPAQPAPVDPVGLVRGPVDHLGLQPPPEGVARQGGDFVVTGDGQATPTVINVPRPTTAAAIPDPPPAARPAAPAPVARPAPAPAPAPAPRPAPAARRPAPAITQTDYWVQAGSFSTIVNAERAKEELASRGITSIIESRAVGDANWFRVRVGPYTSQDEANHWRYLIVSISGFEESMVWQTARRQAN